MLEQYREHVAERAAEGIVPQPLNAEQVSDLVELIKQPPAGEEEFILDLLIYRVPAGVDEAAYVKAGFLAAIAKSEATSPILDSARATELLGTMLGGYNIQPLIELLDNKILAPIVVKALSHTLLVFDAFHDVKEKADAGNEFARQIIDSWAEAEWFTSKAEVPEKLTMTVLK
jgi:aconitase (EC 4.2.1.3)